MQSKYAEEDEFRGFAPNISLFQKLVFLAFIKQTDH